MRQGRSRSTMTRLAGFPAIKTLEDFDYAFAPGVPKATIAELSALAFIERNENVVLIGPSGVGKTHLAIALGQSCHPGRHQDALYECGRPALDT